MYLYMFITYMYLYILYINIYIVKYTNYILFICICIHRNMNNMNMSYLDYTFDSLNESSRCWIN